MLCAKNVLLSFTEEKKKIIIWRNMRQVHFTVNYSFKCKSLCISINCKDQLALYFYKQNVTFY